MNDRLTIASLGEWKSAGRRIVALTAYDFPTARIADAAGIDLLFVGDSVGTNVLGYASEREVTLDDIRHHLRAVRRGSGRALVLADLPYGTYESPAQGLEHARRLVADGADLVKLERARLDVVTALRAAKIPVCGHIGFTPQTLMEPGGKGRVQGRSPADASALLSDARDLEAAGVCALVVELIPESLAAEITKSLTIPTIGIGAGPHCDGQVLIVQDVTGLTDRTLKLAKAYANGRQIFHDAIACYADEVRRGAFPDAGHSFR